MLFNKFSLNEDFYDNIEDEVKDEMSKSEQIEIENSKYTFVINFLINVSPYCFDFAPDIPFVKFIKQLKYFFDFNTSFSFDEDSITLSARFFKSAGKTEFKEISLDKLSDLTIGNKLKKIMSDELAKHYPNFEKTRYGHHINTYLLMKFEIKCHPNYNVSFEKFHKDIKIFESITYNFMKECSGLKFYSSDQEESYFIVLDENGKTIFDEYAGLIGYSSLSYFKNFYNAIFCDNVQIDKDDSRLIDNNVYKDPYLYRLFHNLNTKPLPKEVDWYDVHVYGFTKMNRAPHIIIAFIELDPKDDIHWNQKSVFEMFKKTIIDKVSFTSLYRTMKVSDHSRKSYEVYICIMTDDPYKNGNKVVSYEKINDMKSTYLKKKVKIDFSFRCISKTAVLKGKQDKDYFDEAQKFYAEMIENIEN